MKEVATKALDKIADKIPDFSKEGLNKSDGGAFLKQPDCSVSVEKASAERGYTAKELNDNADLAVEEKSKVKELSPYSETINDSVRSLDELKIYSDANLTETTVGDKPALIRDDIDLDVVDDDGRTNLERMKGGNAPLDSNGRPIELHHIGQKADSPLAELTRDEHRGKTNDIILHDKTNESLIDRAEFQKEKKEYWQARAQQLEGNANA